MRLIVPVQVCVLMLIDCHNVYCNMYLHPAMIMQLVLMYMMEYNHYRQYIVQYHIEYHSRDYPAMLQPLRMIHTFHWAEAIYPAVEKRDFCPFFVYGHREYALAIMLSV